MFQGTLHPDFNNYMFGLNKDRHPPKSLALITVGIIYYLLQTDINHEADWSDRTINVSVIQIKCTEYRHQEW